MSDSKSQREHSSPSNKDTKRCVEIRLMILQMGSIKTQTEQFNAHLVIEARWLADDSILSEIDQDTLQNLDNGHIIHLPDDFIQQQHNWHPKLFLLNSTINKQNEHIRYSLRRDGDDDHPSSQIYVREHRIIDASFCTTFHLHHYPNDIQELSISIGSSLSSEKVKLVSHPSIASGINREVFESQQEWHLYEHVEVKSRNVRGYLSVADEDGDLDKPGREKERSVLTFSCHVARRSRYFFWNNYCIIFLLTVVAFSSFAITADQIQQRLSVAYTLLLSQIAFRWTISVSNLLPPISYLTTMDKYSIISMFSLVILGAWHAIIGSLMFTYHHSQPVTPDTNWLWVDRYIFFTLAFLYIVMHLVFIICHFRGPYRYQRKMREKDIRYRNENLGTERKNSSDV
ncbi:hypothetical protein I4U23_030007 [Adineta vaga]|nr:hypothetical protein I4U23_030007 [Adineta vaga]